MPTILVADDDAAFRSLVVEILTAAGYSTLSARDGQEALQLASQETVDLVLADQRMPAVDGLELTERLRSGSSPPAVIVITAYGTIPQAVEAVRRGAADYLTKPLESPEALRAAVRRVLRQRSPRPAGSTGFISRNPAVLEMLALADRVAATDATVLLTGESGTGKELLARRLHARSARAGGPFVAVNCAALPAELAESELFGHARGAFTGATERRRGRFEQANGGTLFLDEIGDLSLAIQAKLLRAIQERVIEPVGGSRPESVEFRLISATNRDLKGEAAAGRFRDDLYFRLAVVSLQLPPLRERPEDLELLVPALVESLGQGLNLDRPALEPRAMERLRAHDWPGNVRELRNVLERALIVSQSGQVSLSDLPPLEARGPVAGVADLSSSGPAQFTLAERERQAVLEALEKTGGHRERAAQSLGISVRTLYTRLRQYGIR
jgi:two-component system NtrC family response regulator